MLLERASVSASMPEPILMTNFINGQFVPAVDYLDSENPATRQIIAHVPRSSAAEVNEAVLAAKMAFQSWSKTPLKKRCEYVERLGDALESKLEEFAQCESQDQGKTLTQARKVDVPRAVHNLRFFAESAKYRLESASMMDEMGAVNYTQHCPIGVAGLILPWNLPLYLLTFKLAPCIVFGNTCVCKPSEMTSLTAWKLAQLIQQIGFPPGVINFVFGDGAVTGMSIVQHKDVHLLSFTGSTLIGTQIQATVAVDNKKCSLEMGGKNAAIVCADADLDATVTCCVRSSFLNQGEICLCTSRIYVHRKIYETFLDKFVQATKLWKVGDPMLEDTAVGALISAAHCSKVIGYIDSAKRDGANILCGHSVDSALALSSELRDGHFVPPTIIVNVPDDSKCMREEIFGPVTCVVPFDNVEEAILRVNNTSYGLCACVFTQNLSLAHQISQQLDVGTVWINSWLLRDLRMPFGGAKMSGMGREGMLDSLDFYTEKKTICVYHGNNLIESNYSH